MNSETEETMLDLLYKKAVHGLNDEEEKQLAELERSADSAEELNSLELTAASLSMTELESGEPLPADLQSRILADAERFFDDAEERERKPAGPPSAAKPDSGLSIWGWLGWAAAAAACIALAFNIYSIRFANNRAGIEKPPLPTPTITLTPEQMRQQLIETAPDLARAEWRSPDEKAPDKVLGDVVWSDDMQAGYVRLRGLPVNDANKETYQLWIYDETQDPKTPIDGGTFDIASDGEVIIPIDAKLKPRNTKMFAITVEKPGGVVVSKGERVAALAKRET